MNNRMPQPLDVTEWRALRQVVQEELARIEVGNCFWILIDEAPAVLLPQVGRLLGMSGIEWDLAGTDEKRRALLKEAFRLHVRKGTRWAIEKILEMLEISAISVIREWHEIGYPPFWFEVEVNGAELTTPLSWERLFALLSKYKRGVDSFGVAITTNDGLVWISGAHESYEVHHCYEEV